MKQIVTAGFLVAIALAGCTSLPQSVRHPFAGHGSTAASTTTAKDNAQYPYDAPY
jgi:hypothetical protein